MEESSEQSNSDVEVSDYSDSPKPPLKWAGGKRWLLPHLLPVYKSVKSSRLVEPFVGAMSVALGLKPKKALLNDLNPHLINFYNHLKNGLAIEDIYENEEDFFYQKRARFNQLIGQGDYSSKSAAALFYYLNRTGFNGLCRFNSKGEFNVPFGRYKSINYKYDFSAYRPILKNWEFCCADFEKLKIKEGDFLYIDPPYDVEFTKYSKEDFGWEDQLRLVKWLEYLPCPIVASNQGTERIVKLYRESGFKIKLLQAPRRIACNGDREPALEMLATKSI